MHEAPALGFKFKYISVNRLRLGLAAVAAGWFVWAGASLLCCGQEQTTPVAPVAAVVKDNRFETPKATICHFRNAVRLRNWRDEYDCYSDKLKARFAFHVVIGTREMSDSKDLAAKVGVAFQKFRLPANVLDRFPSLRSNVVVNGANDELKREMEIKELERARERQLETWSTEVYSRDIDWGGLIEELQPLYFEKFRRHERGLHHPSQNGIVWHLNYHTFDPVTELKIHDDRSEGTIIACLREDPNVIVEEDVTPDDENESTSWKLSGFAWRKLLSLEAWNQGQKRAADTISLVRLNDGWKIDAVPYR